MRNIKVRTPSIQRSQGIPQVAHTAVEKKLDGSRTTRDFLMRP